MKHYWFSGYTQIGNQFSYDVMAVNTSSAIIQFCEDNPNCEIADYGCYEEED